MMSEGIHSLVDTGNQVLLYGMKRAAKPADEDFPFGYGKEYISGVLSLRS